MPGHRVRPAIPMILCAALLLLGNSVAASADGPEPPPCNTVAKFDPANFPNAPKIDNQWAPLAPGTQFTFAGEADRGGGLLPHRVVSTVTDLTKMINGVPTVVILEKDVNEGELQEAELRFEAQDNAGNVWNLGEYPEEYEDGEFSAAPDVWLAGLGKAQPGNSMLGDPQLGTPEYLQGWSPDIEFLDCAKVSKMQQRTCAPVGCYKNVMIIDEWSPLDPDSGHQLKYHAPGVGNVRVGFVDDPEGEVLVLAKVVQLGPAELIKVRQDALKLEEHANKISKLYRQTPRLELASSVTK
jgi:hypothetical protein